MFYIINFLLKIYFEKIIINKHYLLELFQSQVLNLLKSLQNELKLTYIFITHDLSIAKHMSDNIMVLYFGKCVEMKECKQLFTNPQHEYTKQLIASVPQISKIFTC